MTEPTWKPNCLSGTFSNDAKVIESAIRKQQAASLAACPSQIRRKRKPAQWRTMYRLAMLEKRGQGKLV